MRYWGVFLLMVLACSATAADLAGRYAGEWNGSAAAGDMKLTLTKSDKDWKCEVSFTLGGQEVPTTMKRVKIDGDKVEIEYDFDLQGNKLTSTLTGQLEGQTLSGKYHTVDSEKTSVDDGGWKVTRK